MRNVLFVVRDKSTQGPHTICVIITGSIWIIQCTNSKYSFGFADCFSMLFNLIERHLQVLH